MPRRRLGSIVHAVISDAQEEQRQVREGEGEHRCPCMRRFVLSTFFEVSMGLLIIGNCAYIGWQAQVREPKGTTKLLMDILEHVFTGCFVIELIMRIIVFGFSILVLPENYLDVFLVLLGVVVSWILTPAGVQAEWLRKFTVLRTLRLVRLARAVRLRPEFKDMWFLLKGLTDSAETLLWTYVMIACVLYFFAIMFTALVGNDEAFKDDEIAQEYFGDVPMSMLTLFQVMTLDSWTGIMRPLMEIQPWVWIYFVIYIAVSVFVLMNLVTAVIVESAFAASKSEDQEVAARKAAEKEAELEDLRLFFSKLDQDGNGKLTKAELHAGAQNRKIQQKLRTLDIATSDIDQVWDSLDDGDGELDADEFVEGIRRLQGEAKAKDILRLSREMKVMQASVADLEDGIEDAADRLIDVRGNLRKTRSDIEAFRRTLARVKDSMKQASKTQRLMPVD